MKGRGVNHRQSLTALQLARTEDMKNMLEDPFSVASIGYCIAADEVILEMKANERRQMKDELRLVVIEVSVTALSAVGERGIGDKYLLGPDIPVLSGITSAMLVGSTFSFTEGRLA